MINKISPIDSITKYNLQGLEDKKKTTYPEAREKINTISGIPRSYISFRAKSDEIPLADDAKQLLDKAKNIAIERGHKEITPYHVIEAAIEETEDNINLIGDEFIKSGAIESVSVLNKLANNYSKRNLLLNKNDKEYFLELNSVLKENNDEYLNSLPVDEACKNADREIPYSADFESKLKELLKKTPELDGFMLLGTAFNTIIGNNNFYAAEYLKYFSSMSFYKDDNVMRQNYLKVYDAKAIDVWNKLALGSNLFVTYEDSKEADRITSSLVKTLNAPKHGNFNSKNTLIYAMTNDINAEDLFAEVSEMQETLPDKKLIFMFNMDNMLANALNPETKTAIIPPELVSLIMQPKSNVKFIIFQHNDSYFQCMQIPVLKKAFSDFLQHPIPPIHTYETQEILNNNRKLTGEVKTPFSKDARDKAILYADKTNGIFPDKAVDLMKRIADYYGEDKKRITVKDVDEFASIANELFNKEDSGIVYDTGKNLTSLYGKNTTKKDVEGIVRQIRTKNFGTKGLIIYSKDDEAGSGRRHTAQVIAGEAKIPFLEINSSDFAVASRDEDDGAAVLPKDSMARIFTNAKKAAEQNENKTAIIYINNFEEFAFSSPYLPGYKQAMSQLVKEMAKAEAEKANILVIGSTEGYYADVIPMVVRGFNQILTVDSPAFNKQSRKEILTNRINEINLKLACRNNAEKDELINKLVKMTDYMSFVQIKSLVEKTEQIMIERNKQKASIGDFIEAYLQLTSGRTSLPQMPDYNKRATTSHECGHATNLEVMNELLREKGKPWHQYRDVDFITLDPRGEFLGAVFEGRSENSDYPFEAMFTGLVCAYGGYSCEKMFFDMDGSHGISQDLAQATAQAKRGIEYFGFGANTGKISNAVQIASTKFNETVFKDLDIILKNAQMASDLITETYKEFNEWFTNKYAKLIGSDNCMIDGDDFRKALKNWKTSQTPDKKEEISIMEDMILDIIRAAKNGRIYGQVKKVL